MELPLPELGKTEGQIAGGDEGFSPGHVKFEVCVRPSREDVELVVGSTHTVWKFRGVVSAGDGNLGVVSVHLSSTPRDWLRS